MLEFVRGEVARISGGAVVLDVGGVGLRVQMPTGDLAGLRGHVTVQTVLVLRDDDVQLYGFATDRGRELFRALTSVSGVGPKLALAVLSFHAPDDLERAIVAGDAGALALVSGVGKKTAQRIVLELRDKLGVGGESPAAIVGPMSEVREALGGLGYTPAEIADAIRDLPADGDAPTLLKLALRMLDRETV